MFTTHLSEVKDLLFQLCSDPQELKENNGHAKQDSKADPFSLDSQDVEDGLGHLEKKEIGLTAVSTSPLFSDQAAIDRISFDAGNGYSMNFRMSRINQDIELVHNNDRRHAKQK